MCFTEPGPHLTAPRLSKQGTVWFAGDSNKPPEKITAGQHRANTSRNVQRKAKPKSTALFQIK